MRRMLSQYRRRGGWLYWALSVGLLLLGALMGTVWSHHFLGMLKPSILHIQRLAEHLQQNGSVTTEIWTVFLNNARVALMMMGLGIFAGVFPVFTMWTNGLMMGVVTRMVAEQAHVATWKVALFGELPHGIFELTALCWACACGIRLAVAALQSVWTLLTKGGVGNAVPVQSGTIRAHDVDEPLTFRGELRYAVGRIPWIMAILFVAACIEILVTPHLIHVFGA